MSLWMWTLSKNHVCLCHPSLLTTHLPFDTQHRATSHVRFAFLSRPQALRQISLQTHARKRAQLGRTLRPLACPGLCRPRRVCAQSVNKRTELARFTTILILFLSPPSFAQKRNVHDPRALAAILEKAEEKLARKRHPDPYIRVYYDYLP